MNINWTLGILLFVILISHFFSTYSLPSIGLVLNMKFIFSPGTFAFFSIILGFLWYYMVVSVFDGESIYKLLDAMCLVALVNVGFQILQLFGIDPINTYETKQRLGLAININICSALLAFCTPAFFRGKWKWFLPLIVLGLYLADSRGGILALGCGLLVWCTFKNINALWLGALGILAATAVIAIEPESLTGSAGVRFEMWRMGWERFWDHPILGHGPGHWQTALHEAYYKLHESNTWHARAHNEFIQATFEYGVGFLVWLGIYFWDIIKRIHRKAVLSVTAVAIIAVNSMVNFPLHLACTGIIAVTWLAILEIELREV